MQTERKEFLFKILFLGESHVGKTSIINRFINKQFKDNNLQTIGIDFYSKTLEMDGDEKMDIKLQIWDTAGQERFQVLGKQYLIGVMGVVLVFSYDSQQSLNQIQKWLEYIQMYGDKYIQLVFVANKSDLREQQYSLSDTQIHSQLALFGINKYLQVSAKENQNVDQIFKNLSHQIYSKYMELNQQKKNNKQVNVEESIYNQIEFQRDLINNRVSISFGRDIQSYRLENKDKKNKKCC